MAMRDRADNCVIICSIENIDPMGVHTGDSATVAPIQTLTDDEYQKMRNAAIAIMMSVIALSLPEMVILRKVLKVPLLLAFAGIVGCGILLVGYLFNFLL